MDKIAGQIKPEQIIEIIFRRRWFIIIPFCLAMLTGTYLAIKLPRVYESSTLILVERQRVPSDYVQSVVSSDIDARINTISQQILSRSNIEKLIDQLNLFTDSDSDKLFMEEKVESVRERITVEVTQSRRDDTDAFTVSFKGEEPEKVKQVVNSLASFFINENLKVREAQAMGTSEFLEGELGSMRATLELVEEKMKDYRRRYMGELPEQLDSNLRILDRIQEQIADSKNRLLLLEQQIDIGLADQGSRSSAQNGSERNQTLQELKNELASLSTKYTKNHPDILRLKKQIASRLAQKQSIDETDDETEQQSFPADIQVIIEARNLRTEIVELKKQAEVYKKRIENTPKREQELMSLNRDYQNIQDSYSSLLSRKLEADISVNMEHKQKGERFRIIDPAILPEKPVEPDMRKLFIFVLAAGLGIGGGLVFLLEYLDPSFRQVEDIETYIGIPVLASIPQIRYPEIVMRERIHKLFTGLSLTISFILFTTFLVVVFIGHENTVGILGEILHG